ncbi:hypothetical protein EDD15DRAFT_2274513 [Pisolithus albus]|nr:hypothetical protein EDD15DRAFT_2274513 [Pisolithus albus]
MRAVWLLSVGQQGTLGEFVVEEADETRFLRFGILGRPISHRPHICIPRMKLMDTKSLICKPHGSLNDHCMVTQPLFSIGMVSVAALHGRNICTGTGTLSLHRREEATGCEERSTRWMRVAEPAS